MFRWDVVRKKLQCQTIPLIIRALVDAHCGDGTSEISCDLRTKRLKTQQESVVSSVTIIILPLLALLYLLIGTRSSAAFHFISIVDGDVN